MEGRAAGVTAPVPPVVRPAHPGDARHLPDIEVAAGERFRSVGLDAVADDDVESVAEWTDPPLTTVHQDIEGMGRLMARLLLRRLATEGPGGAPAAGPLSSIITSTRLVVRAST